MKAWRTQTKQGKSYQQKFVSNDNPKHNILQKIRKIKRYYDPPENVDSRFRVILSVIVENLILEERPGTTLCPQQILIFY